MWLRTPRSGPRHLASSVDSSVTRESAISIYHETALVCICWQINNRKLCAHELRLSVKKAVCKKSGKYPSCLDIIWRDCWYSTKDHWWQWGRPTHPNPSTGLKEKNAFVWFYCCGSCSWRTLRIRLKVLWFISKQLNWTFWMHLDLWKLYLTHHGENSSGRQHDGQPIESSIMASPEDSALTLKMTSTDIIVPEEH